MSTRTRITCHCGNRIQPDEVLQQGRFLRLDSPSLIYIKYRCSRCKRLGERFVLESQWTMPESASSLRNRERRERERLASLGPITADEAEGFRDHLQKATLDDILRDLK